MSRFLQVSQYVCLLAVVAVVIMIVWFPGLWLRLLLTVVVLVIAAASINSARDNRPGLHR